MYRGLRVATVIRARNEARLIGRTVSGVPAFVDHVIVVDDASADETAAAAKAAGDSRLEVITLIDNVGVGGATVMGHRQAMTLGADVCVVMDGDDQMDAEFMPALLDPIADGTAEFTKANRFYGMGSFAGMPRLRVFGNVALSFLTKMSSGYWDLFDPQNGYTAVHRNALQRLELERLVTGYEFESRQLIHLNILRVRAADVPVPARYGDEVSGLRIRTVAPRLISELWTGFWSRIWWKYVLQSFSAVALMLFGGLALCAVGAVFSVWAIADSWGAEAATAGTVILAVAPLLSGFQMLLYSMLLDIQEAKK